MCVFPHVRERQKEQIAQAISDGLQHAVRREVEQNSGRLRGAVEAVSEDIKREMTTTLQEVHTQ